MKIELQLKSVLQKAFLDNYQLSLDIEELGLQITRKEFAGTFSLPVFPYAKKCNEHPTQLAEKIGEWLQDHTDLISSYNVISGFLNLVIHDKIWLNVLAEIEQNPNYGCLDKRNSNVVVEFSCPNTNKPQHLGHLRTNFLGSALSKILDAAGYTVYTVNLINDRGIHICKSMVAYQQFGSNETPESSGIKGDHLVGKYYVKFDQVYKEQLAHIQSNGEDATKTPPPILQEAQKMLIEWEKGNPSVMALWKKMNNWVYDGFHVTYHQLGIAFDKTYYESDTYLLGKKIVEEGVHKKIFYKRSDGAIAIDLSQYELGEKVLLRGDGTAVYITQDLGTADLRYTDYHFDKMIYVVGNEQEHHFKVLFAIMDALDRPYASSMHHLSYGMVDLPSGKMKSREGNVVDADNLIAEMIDTIVQYTEVSNKIGILSKEEQNKLHNTLAVGALKFFLLKVIPQKRMLFNPNDSVDFQGDTGTFIQYTYARICSLESKASDITIASPSTYNRPLSPLEQSLIFQLYMLPTQIEEAAKHYAPSIIANYALELAKTYNKFYAACPILRASNISARSFRLLLSFCVAKVLKRSMALLTIELPAKM
ncbi:arginine--tRNA ligase [Cardinium endosymbiont of Culicoides punctatus]|uniref:arginine--tRNA ligase n=1 Tax=Cardinium endosymbiont of Culicoides punctatus TaxID=2304601 RepID=UPI00105883EA|nr:arginine--tRNA ligase [Cardinium endosymbiont of Culicoides punctatus]TDG95615.1 Arginine--tRNA ligase [Cardinium endosymbiont of Culicoides punctatus]